MLTEIHGIIDTAQDWLWTYVNIGLLVGCALFFTFRMRGIQFRLFGDMVRQMFRSGAAPDSSSSKKQISSFQAFIVALASRIGTGNLAGVATAISVGGPGAIFWMWVWLCLAQQRLLWSRHWHSCISVATVPATMADRHITCVMAYTAAGWVSSSAC